jgi:hypothetical protein
MRFWWRPAPEFYHFARAGVSGPAGAARIRLTGSSPTIARHDRAKLTAVR